MSLPRKDMDLPYFSQLEIYITHKNIPAIEALILTVKAQHKWLVEKSEIELIGKICKQTIIDDESEVLRLLMAAGFSIDSEVLDSETQTKHSLIFYAAFFNRLDMLKFLMPYALNVHKNHFFKMHTFAHALETAIQKNHVAVVDYFLKMIPQGISLKSNAYFNEPLLITACKNNLIEMADLLSTYLEHTEEAIQFLLANADNFSQDIFKNTLMLLFDLSIGCNFETRLANQFFINDIDISHINFIGLSFQGQPITRRTLADANLTGTALALVTPSDLSKLEDVKRKRQLEYLLEKKIQTRGLLIENNGVLNLSSLEICAAAGHLSAFQIRLKSHMPTRKKMQKALYLAAKNGHLEITQLAVASQIVAMNNLLNATAAALFSKQKTTTNYLMSLNIPNQKDERGLTLLNHAAMNGDVDTVSELIKTGFDIHTEDNEGHTPLHHAILFATTPAHFNVMNILLKAGANPYQGKKGSCFETAIWKTGSSLALSKLMPYLDMQDPNIPHYLFYVAKLSENILFLSFFKSQGIHFNVKKEGRPLLEMCMTDVSHSFALLNFLLTFGVNPSLINDNTGQNALHALMKVQFENTSQLIIVLNLMLQKNIDLNTQDFKGRTALHLAVKYQNREAVEFLIQHHADLNCVDCKSMSVLHVAMQTKNVGIIKLILNAKPNVNLRDQYGLNAMDYLEKFDARIFPEFLEIKKIIKSLSIGNGWRLFRNAKESVASSQHANLNHTRDIRIQ